MSSMWNKNGRLISWKVNENVNPGNPGDTEPAIIIPRITRRVGDYEDSIVPSCYGGNTNNLYTYYNNFVFDVFKPTNLFISTNNDGSIKTNNSQASILKLNRNPSEYVWVPALGDRQKIKNEAYDYSVYDPYLKVRTMIWKDSNGNKPQYDGNGLLVEPNFVSSMQYVDINSFFVVGCKNAVPKGFYRGISSYEKQGDTYIPIGTVETDEIVGRVNKLMTYGEWSYYTISNSSPQSPHSTLYLTDEYNSYIAVYPDKQSFGIFAAIAFDIEDKSEETMILPQYVEQQIIMTRLIA